MEIVAGVDEVGRGAWFGPVVAAAVILPLSCFADLRRAGVKDSKRLCPTDRQKLVPIIYEKAIAVAIGQASVAEIDRMNILEASLLAMERAIGALEPRPHHCLVDGSEVIRFRDWAPVPQTCLVKGDQISVAIGAASIVAKVWRDRLLVNLAKAYPGYDLERNKGYGTPKHRGAVQVQGLTDQHRRSFHFKSLGQS